MKGAMTPTVTFRIFRGDVLVAEQSLCKATIKVGSGSSAHVRLDDDTVDRSHAVIDVADSSNITIIDLGGGGTRVNGKHIGGKGRLRSGDSIQVGETRIEFVVAGAEEAVSTPHGNMLAAHGPEAAVASTPAWQTRAKILAWVTMAYWLAFFFVGTALASSSHPLGLLAAASLAALGLLLVWKAHRSLLNVRIVREDDVGIGSEFLGTIFPFAGIVFGLIFVVGAFRGEGSKWRSTTAETQYASKWLAWMCAEGSISRTESRGCHYRTDHRKMDNQRFLRHTMLRRGDDGEMKLSYNDVTIEDIQPEAEVKY